VIAVIAGRQDSEPYVIFPLQGRGDPPNTQALKNCAATSCGPRSTEWCRSCVTQSSITSAEILDFHSQIRISLTLVVWVSKYIPKIRFPWNITMFWCIFHRAGGACLFYDRRKIAQWAASRTASSLQNIHGMDVFGFPPIEHTQSNHCGAIPVQRMEIGLNVESGIKLRIHFPHIYILLYSCVRAAKVFSPWLSPMLTCCLWV
jgi:hypothetical protein